MNYMIGPGVMFETIKIDQRNLPTLPTDRKLKFSISGTKWPHLAEKWIVEMLATFAVKNQAWCVVLWEDLVKMSKKEHRHQLDHELAIAIAVCNMVATGDLGIAQDANNNKKFYLVPLPEQLGKTIARCKYGWHR